MASVVQLKRSSVSGRIPDAANIEVGEPVVNLADQILFTKDGSGTVKIIGAGTTSNISEGTNQYFTNARVVTAVQNNSITNANIGNLVANYTLTVGNPSTTGYRFPLQDGSALQILQTDGNGQISFVNLEQASGGGYTVSTLVQFPGSAGNVDYGADEAFVGETSGQLVDAFGVPLGSVYDCMEPNGRMVYEDLEAA
jgi:predicted secreted protein